MKKKDLVLFAITIWLLAMSIKDIFAMGSEYDKTALASVVVSMYLVYACGIELISKNKAKLQILISRGYLVVATVVYILLLIMLVNRYGTLGDMRFEMISVMMYIMTAILAFRDMAKAKKIKDDELQ